MLRTQVIRATRPVFARTFAGSARVQKDLVQDVYLKELKNYKPSTKAADTGATKSFSSFTAPKAPQVLEASGLAKELEAYDADIATAEAPKSASAAAENDALGADEYLALVEQEASAQPQAAHH